MSTTTSTQTVDGTGRKLQGNLGVFAIMFMIIAGAAPLTTVSATVPVALVVANGVGYPLMYIAAGVLLLFFTIGMVAMTPHVKRSGAFYAYVTAGIGRGSGIATSYVAMFVYSITNFAVWGFMGAVLSEYVASFSGVTIPWWVFSLVVLVIIGITGYMNIDLSAKVLAVVLIGEVLICLVFDIVVTAVGGGPEGLTLAPLMPSHIFAGAPALGVSLAASGFVGFEAAAVFRAEAKDPDKTLPRALYGSLAVISIFYFITAWSMINAWGEQGSIERANNASSTMLVDAIADFMGPVGYTIVQYLLMASTFACILTFHNVIARYTFSMSNTGVLPKWFGVSHHKHGSPSRASLSQSISAAAVVILAAILGLEPIAQVFTWGMGVLGVGFLFLVLVTCIAIVGFFAKKRPDLRPQYMWKGIISPIIGAILIGYMLFLTARELPSSFGGSIGLTIGFTLAPITLLVIAGYVTAAVNKRANTEEAEREITGTIEVV